MAAITDDDGFREIQLNGKQLVFLFMAATVVSVAIFLIGVLVGRGVRAERAESGQAEAPSEAPVSIVSKLPAATPDDADPRKAQPPSPAGDVDVDPKSAKQEVTEDPPVAVKRGSPTPPAVTAKPADIPVKQSAPQAHIAPAPATVTSAPVPTAAPPAPATPPAIPAAASAGTAVDAAAHAGYAVQVAAVPAREEADTIVKRLAAKGYSAYVEAPKGSVTLYRVRVGTFKSRSEALATSDRLRKEEKFKPWVTTR